MLDDSLEQEVLEFQFGLHPLVLRYVDAYACDGQTAAPRFYNASARCYPQGDAVFAQHAVLHVVLFSLVEGGAHFGADAGEVVGLDRIGNPPVDHLDEIGVRFASQHANHLVVGEKDGEALFAVAPDEPVRGALREYLSGDLLVFGGELSDRLIRAVHAHDFAERLLRCAQRVFLHFVVRNVEERGVEELCGPLRCEGGTL